MPVVGEGNVLDNPRKPGRRLTPQERRAQRISRSQQEQRELYKDANNIYPIPDIVNPMRREDSRYNFKLYCEYYHPEKFCLRWSPVHLDVLQTMENMALREPGTLCYAMFRGFGKTSIAETFAQWCLLNGHKRYIVIIAATQQLAKDLVKAQVLELETNERLYEDYPEVCYPIRCLERNYIRTLNQHVDEKPTRISYKVDGFSLPVIDGSVSSGSKVHSVGLTGSLRGLKHTLPSGEVIRPDFVIIDDPQTDASAKSEQATATRERIINGAIKGLAGPKTVITAVMPCTVIRSNDLAERFLDRNRRPQWQGKRTSLLPSMPKNMDLWRKYADVRAESLRSGMGVKPATDYYATNRSAMDEGAEVTWLERYDERFQISAIQAAMDLYFDDPVAFASEYQNQPLLEANSNVNHNLILTAEKLLDRTSGIPYGTVPRSTLYLTTGIDIQQKILYYTTVAWTEDFGGIICDYGTYPKQHTYEGWTAQNPPIAMNQLEGNENVPLIPMVYKGLAYIRDEVISKGFRRDESDDIIYPHYCLIDANWALSADAVYSFSKQNESLNKFLPSHGRGVGANMIPMDQWAKKQGEQRFWNAQIRLRTNDANRGRHCIFDGHTWKTLIAERLLVHKSMGNALLFYGDSGYRHLPFINHCVIEKPEAKQGRGRVVDEWSAEQSMVENHWWDCLIQSAVAANISGLQVHVRTETNPITNETTTAGMPQRTRKKVSAPPPAPMVIR